MQALGKRLGKAIKPVGDAIRAMSREDIAAFEAAGEVTVAGHTLHTGDIKVRGLPHCGGTIAKGRKLLPASVQSVEHDGDAMRAML